MPSYTFLVVDDFQPFRQLLSLALQQNLEYQVICEVSDGLEAAAKVQELQPDLILLDIGLPNLNGIEVAKRARELAPRAKVLFISQESSPEIVQEALSLGAGYVLKSRVETDLLPAIEAVLMGKRFVSSGLDSGDAADDLALDPHEIVFCSGETALLDSLTRFVAVALNAGNPALVVVTESHHDSLLQELRARGVNVDSAIQRETYISFDADKELDPVRFFDTVRGLRVAASKVGKKHPRIAICGERAGRLWADGKIDEALRLEQFADELAKNHAVDILCAYPLPSSRYNDDGLKSILELHSAVHSK